jgi:hypothetical protein
LSPPSSIPEQKWVGSSLCKSPSLGGRKSGTVVCIHFTHWATSSLIEVAGAPCALRLEKAPELTKARERVRTVTELNFIIASTMRHHARLSRLAVELDVERGLD